MFDKNRTRFFLCVFVFDSLERKDSRKETVSDRLGLVRDPIESWTSNRDKSALFLWPGCSSPSSVFLCSVRTYFQFSRYIRPLAIEDKTFSSLSWPGCLPGRLRLPALAAGSLNDRTASPLLYAESSFSLFLLSRCLFPFACAFAHTTYTFTLRREK